MRAEGLSPYQQEVMAIWKSVCREAKEGYYKYGRGQGALRNCRDNLRLLLEERFGELPPEVVREIEATPDLHRLKRAQAAVLDMAAATDLRLLPADWRAELDRGRRNGAWDNCRDDLLALLDKRFGQVPDAVVRRLETTADVAQLQTWLREAVHVPSLAELHLQG